MQIYFALRSCPVCNSAVNQPIFTDINRREGLPVRATLVKCSDCGMYYLNPAPDLSSLRHIYGDGFVDPIIVELPQLQVVSRILPAISPLRYGVHRINGNLRGHPHDWPDDDGQGRSLLDFGCHDGAKLAYWYQHGWQVAGIDLNEQAIKLARRRFPKGQFWCGDLLSLEIKSRFDCIRADNVVEHLLDPKEYLTALTKMLKPGGYLRIFVPNGAALSTRLFKHYSANYWMPFHLNLFTSATMERLFDSIGLKDITCFTFTPIGSWSWTQRQLLLKPGFNQHPPSRLDSLIRHISILNYPGETLSQWLGMGEELVATGRFI